MFLLQINHTTGSMEQLCKHRTPQIITPKASGLSGGTGGETGVEVETLRKRGELWKSLEYSGKSRSFCTTPEK